MLINLKELLAHAEKNSCAYAAINVPNLETALAVKEAAEELKLPFILSHSPGHDHLLDFVLVSELCQMLAKQATVDVCIHLDHCSDLAYIKKALEAGFTSVMFDGSHLDFTTNTSMSKEVVAMAKVYGASVEAELGTVATSYIGSSQSKQEVEEVIYTDPVQAQEFVAKTGIDALAVAIGTVHGVYAQEPQLDFQLIKEIKERVKIPLVMHGGSGIPDADILKAIACGIKKINYYTYASIAGGVAIKEYVQNKDLVFFHDVSLIGKAAMKADALRVMRLFSLGTTV